MSNPRSLCAVRSSDRRSDSGVSLTSLKRKHFALFYKWWNDPELRKLTSEAKGRISEEEINKILDRHLENQDGRDFIITVDRQPVGHILIQKKNRKKHFEIYIAIGEKSFWGRGIGTASMKKACAWFFKNHKQEEALDLEVLVNNARAIRTYENVGFQRIKTIRNKKSTDTYLMRKSKGV